MGNWLTRISLEISPVPDGVRGLTGDIPRISPVYPRNPRDWALNVKKINY